MLKISDVTIEQIADGIVDLIKQGRLLKRDAKGGDGWQGKENLEIFWYNYIKRVDPHEKKYIVIINSMLTRQAKGVFDKIKKHPNSYKKWMFDRKKWLREFADAEAKFIVKLYKQEGQKAIDLALKLSRKSYYKAEEIPISIAFDVYNPEVTEALVTQTTRFPAGVVGTSEKIIRREIANGLELGESIDKLRKRVTERLGPTYIKNRAEMIARSETIYASNAGAELGYMQSGVVEGKKWLTAIDERTCDSCIDMNNMTAPLGQPTWEKEGLDIGDVQGKYGLDFDYTEGEMPFPPLHPRCRCTITPIVKMVEKFKPAKTIKEAEKYGTRFSKSVSYKDLNVNIANMINKNLDEMFKKYKLEPINIITTKPMPEPMSANYAKQRLIISTRLKDNKNVIKALEEFYEKGFLAGGKVKDIEIIFQRLVNHEMIHLQFYRYTEPKWLVKNMESTKRAYVTAINKASRAGNMALYNKLKISDYAKYNIDEFAAEAFNDFRFSKKPSMFSKQAYELILEAIKKK